MDLSNHTPANFNVSVGNIHALLPAMANLTLNDKANFNVIDPADLQKQLVDQAAYNAAFALGQGLRQVWDITTTFLGNIYSSFKNTRASHFMNEEDFDYQVHQNINAETCVEGYEEQCKVGYPQAIVLQANFSKDAYGIEQFMDRIFVENSCKHQIFLNTLAKKHRVHNLVMSNDQDMCEIIKKARKLGPIRFLYIDIHGNGASIRTSSEHNDFRKDSIDIYDYYAKNLGNQDLSCLELMDEGSVIILMSCNTAKDITFEIKDNPYTFPASIQKLFALHAPQSKVFSADFYAIKNSIVIKQDANGNMQVYLQGVDSENYFNATLDYLKILIHWLSWFKKDLNNPYLNELFLLKPMKEISKEKANFCKEVLPYFAMKRFCDNAKVQPSPEKMSVCNTDPKCKEATNALSSVHERARRK